MSRFSDRAVMGRLAQGFTLALSILALAGGGAAAQSAAPYGLGRAASAAEIKGWDIDIRGDDGLGLPPGKGSVKQGEELYLAQCASCHGEFGEGNGRWPELMGGRGTLTSEDPRKTIGSFWPYAPTVFDYIRRSMPMAAPQSLSDDETYAIVAYLLHLNDLLPADAELDAEKLRGVRLPNRDGFLVGDPRPDVPVGEPCMKDCRRDPPRITSDLAEKLGVTPERKPRD